MMWVIILGLIWCVVGLGFLLYGWIYNKNWALALAFILIVGSGVIVELSY